MIPTVPKRSRQDGERTFFRYKLVYLPKNSTSKFGFYVNSIDMADNTTDYSITFNYVNSPDLAEVPAAGEGFYAVGVGHFSGYYVATVVDTVNKTVVATAPKSPSMDQLFALGPSFSWLEGDIVAVKSLLTTGQATDASGNVNTSRDTISAIGRADKSEVTDRTYNFNVTLYTDDELAVASIVGSVDAIKDVTISDATKFTVRLNDDLFKKKLYVFLERYTGRGSDARLLHTTVYEEVEIDDLDTNDTAGKNNYSQWSVSGIAKDKYIVKHGNITAKPQ